MVLSFLLKAFANLLFTSVVTYICGVMAVIFKFWRFDYNWQIRLARRLLKVWERTYGDMGWSSSLQVSAKTAMHFTQKVTRHTIF